MDFPPLDKVGEEIQTRLESAERNLRSQPNIKTRLAIGAAALLEASIGVLGVRSVDNIPTPAEIAIECGADIDCISRYEAQIQPGERRELEAVVKKVTSTTSPPTTVAAPIPTTIAAPPPAPEFKLEYRTPVSPETATRIEAINLTARGYEETLNGIDLSWFEYSQSKINFNPQQNGIAQGKTEWVTAHYMANFHNESGPSPQPVGEMSVKNIVDFLATRGKPCCAINFMIDRNGRLIQTAPFNAKLRHNPPYDSQTVGFEIEAAEQDQITTKQYETASYLTVALLQLEGLLDPNTLSQRFRGHGDMRDNLRDEHRKAGKDIKWEDRNDFDAPIMGLWTPKVEGFVRATPTIPKLTKPLR